MALPYELRNKVVLITGGARGIGFATAQAAVRRGAKVAIVDLELAAADGAAAQLQGDGALGLGADVTDRSAMQRAVAATVERFGGLDVVVANAGIASRAATFRAMSTEAFERVLDVNLMGVWHTVDAALPEIVRRQGHVVVIASVYAFMNGVGLVPYAISKAGVEQFGRALRVELAGHGASASVAYFGFIDTEMVRRGLDADPLAERMIELAPRPLRKRVPPNVAGDAIVRGIEHRAARIIRPRRWVLMSLGRGFLSPLLDNYMRRDAQMQGVVAQLDARGNEDQPTTA